MIDSHVHKLNLNSTNVPGNQKQFNFNNILFFPGEIPS